MCLEMASQSRTFFEQIRSFIAPMIDDNELLDELIAYQSFVIRAPQDTEKSQTFHYDFYRFFRHINTGTPEPLCQTDNTLILRNKYGVMDWETFATEIVWYGRKDARILYHPDEMEQEF